ncbi:hypothetical protein FACS1894196_4120 [Clostridia bacterium]|nr:hypothetical protein FACS1894196_4120 [Clostridia bacterium]
MAVTTEALLRVPWHITRAEAARLLSVPEHAAAAFARAFDRAAAGFAPVACAREVRVDAVGDDFVMLSGEWFEGVRTARRLADASRVYVYSAVRGEASPQGDDGFSAALDDLAAQLSTRALSARLTRDDGEGAGVIAPGEGGWLRAEQDALVRLLGDTGFPPHSDAVGLLFFAPVPDCAGGGGPCGHCGVCARESQEDGTNAGL